MTFSNIYPAGWLTLIFIAGNSGVGAYCPEIGTAIYEYGFMCFSPITTRVEQGRNPQTIEQILATDLYWKTYCSTVDALDDCFSGDDFSGCAPEVRAHYANETRIIIGRDLAKHGLYPDTESLCEGANLSNTTAEVYSRVDAEEFSHCAAGKEAQLCLRPWYNESAQYYTADMDQDNPSYSYQELLLLRRWAVATRQCLFQAANTTCDSTHQELFDHILAQTTPDVIKGTIDWPDLGPPDQNAIMSLRRRSNVGVFGDPHLLIYNASSLQTCAAEGTRDFLVNDRIKMVGDNQRITRSGRTSRATFLRKFTLSFYDDSGAAVGMYEADEISRPSDIKGTFSNGEKNISIGNDILIVAKTDEVVKIVATHIAATIEIRARGFSDYAFYTLTMRMGDALLDKSRGLLTTGCGIKQRLTQPETGRPTRRKRSIQEMTCARECAKVVNIGNFLFNETCYFDCVTTESTNIGMLSGEFRDSLISIIELDKQLPLVEDSTTVPPVTSPEPSRAANTQKGPWIFEICFVYLIFKLMSC